MYTLLPVFTSSCLESLIQFWSSLYLPPQQIPKRFQNTIRNTYKYGTKGKIRKFVRRSVQKIYIYGDKDGGTFKYIDYVVYKLD